MNSLPVPDGPARKLIDAPGLPEWHCPDSYDLVAANQAIWAACREHWLKPAPEPSAWMRMSEAERDGIRARRRLRSVPSRAAVPVQAAPEVGEAA